MAYIVTPGFGLQLADPATIQQFETSVVNADFLALENGILVERARITTAIADLDTVEGWGAGRSGDSGRTIWGVTDVTNLNTVIAGGAAGDIFFLNTQPTGITRHWWGRPNTTVPYGEPLGTIFAATKANMDAFIALVAAAANLRFRIGGLWYNADTGISYQFTSSAGAYIPIRTSEWNLIKIPTADLVVGGGSIVQTDDGVVTLNGVTFAGDGLRVRNALAAPYNEFKLVFDLTASSNEHIDLGLLTSGTTAGASLAVTYDGVTAAGAAVNATLAVFQLMTGPQADGVVGEIEFRRALNASKPTVVFGRYTGLPVAGGGSPEGGVMQGIAASAQTNAGFKLKTRTSASLSGTIALYGRYKGGA